MMLAYFKIGRTVGVVAMVFGFAWACADVYVEEANQKQVRD